MTSSKETIYSFLHVNEQGYKYDHKLKKMNRTNLKPELLIVLICLYSLTKCNFLLKYNSSFSVYFKNKEGRWTNKGSKNSGKYIFSN